MKKVANKKQRDTAAEDEELKARKAAQGEKENAQPARGAGDILADNEEDDVIF